MADVPLATFTGITLSAALLQGLFGILLLRQYNVRFNWGQGWLALAMLSAAIASLTKLSPSAFGISAFPLESINQIILISSGFLSLSSLVMGTILYTGGQITRPFVVVTILTLGLAGFTVLIITAGIPLGGRTLALGVFVFCTVLVWKAHFKEPDVGLSSLAINFMSYPVVVGVAWLLGLSNDVIDVVSALMYSAIGAILMSIVLERRSRELKHALIEKADREQDILDLNSSLEASIERRTTELQVALQNLEQTQDQLVQSEKLASLGALVAGVAHELNTPLGNAYTMATMLLDTEKKFSQKGDDITRSQLHEFVSDTREGATIIERNLHRANELVKSFRQVAVDQSNHQRRKFQLNELVSEVVLTLKPSLRNRKIRIVQSIDDSLVMNSFPGALSQVIINLINNALIHAYGADSDAEIRIIGRASDVQGFIDLSIEDDGIGIPYKQQPRIFDPFFTTRLGQGSSGLGLHILYNLITGLLQGTINVYSAPSQGTRFLIHIPETANDPQKTDTSHSQLTFANK